MTAHVSDFETLKVLLADDHALFRDGLSHVLKDFNPSTEIIQAVNYPDALNAAVPWSTEVAKDAR